jgi:hypothetical protein
MARHSNEELAFAALVIKGGLLAPDFLHKIAHFEASEQTESEFDIPRGLKLRDEIGRYWKIAQNLWQDFEARRDRADLDSHEVTVQIFLEPFCRHVLGFTDIRPVSQVTIGGRHFPIGFLAKEGGVPLVFAAHDQALDGPSSRHGDGTRRRSPFLLTQEYLNANEQSLWAIVSNGLKFRVLRGNSSLTRPAYIEADLEVVFSEGLYSDFAALWMLAHSTRFGKGGFEPTDCSLERWRNTAQEDGIRARDRLRGGVTEALRALGTGFIGHPGNGVLRQRMQAGELSAQAYFEQLLRLIYRFIFLATIEDRELVFTPNASPEVKARYRAGYSLQRLRLLASRRRSYDRYGDLWLTTIITISGLGRGQPVLGLPALGGLFESNQCPDLDGAALENRALLSALYSLCFVREGTTLSRVNYRDMDSEELGSVYESLLELVPVVSQAGANSTFRFVGDGEDGSTKGNARKLTGSYYTPDSLVQELVKSTLDPVIEQTLKAQPHEPVNALLALTVCDPACGSGHFLLAAARRIADEVARLAAADGSPTPEDYRHALRDVVAHCIYGVDKNPMAVELARTALWLEAYTPDLPLSFLDHHLRCGDALLGVLDPAILERGIPEEAFAVLSGDDKDVAKLLKAENRAALRSLQAVKAADLFFNADEIDAFAEFENFPDDTIDAIDKKRDIWNQRQRSREMSRAAQLADTYVATFLMPKITENIGTIPLSGYFWQLSRGQVDDDNDRGKLSAASIFCRRHQVLHWWLAFPNVYARGGFDVSLGNPPWERIKLQEEEFFALRSPLIAEARHKAERGRRIAMLADGMLLHTLFPEVEAEYGLAPPNGAEQALYAEFLAARRGAEAASLFAHSSGRYPLTGVGDVNTYALFAEAFAQLTRPDGRAGFIVPTGIATDDSTKAYFSKIVSEQRLVRLLSLYEIRGWFKDTDDRKSFCLVTLGQADSAEYLFDAKVVADFHVPKKWFRLSPDEFRLLNPNTLTCPVFRSEHDAELTKKIYRAVPVLIEEHVQQKNSWGVRFMTMFHMSNDSHLFQDAAASDRLPVYEAKMMHQYDHRWATYDENGIDSRDCTITEKSDPAFEARPRYWVNKKEVLSRIAKVPSKVGKAWLNDDGDALWLAVGEWLAASLLLKELPRSVHEMDDKSSDWITAVQVAEQVLRQSHPAWYVKLSSRGSVGKKAATEWPKWARQQWAYSLSFGELAALSKLADDDDAIFHLLDQWMENRCPQWLMGWRDIALRSVERTTIASVFPRMGVGNKIPLFLFESNIDASHAAAFICNLSSLVLDFVARQKIGGTTLNYFYMKQFPVLPPSRYTDSDLAFIVPRVLELTYTSYDLKPWAQDLGFSGAPFPWDSSRRALARAELDAYFARLYGLSREELQYVLDPADVMGDGYPSESFRVLKNSEMRDFGEYRTRRLVLDAWDRQQSGELTWETRELSEVPVVHPEFTVIGNENEARLAGLIAALIEQVDGGISANELQSIVTRATTSGYAELFLEPRDATRLWLLANGLEAVAAPDSVRRIPFLLGRMEFSGAIGTVHRDNRIAFTRTERPLPLDVKSFPEIDELAALMLALDARREQARKDDVRLKAQHKRDTDAGTGTG